MVSEGDISLALPVCETGVLKNMRVQFSSDTQNADVPSKRIEEHPALEAGRFTGASPVIGTNSHVAQLEEASRLNRV